MNEIGYEIYIKKKEFLFFDFNNHNDYLRKYYYYIHKEITSPYSSYYSFIYYYTSDDYEKYSFEIHQKLESIKKEVMGSSIEGKQLEYYIEIIQQLLQTFGQDTIRDFSLVCRFGSQKMSEKINKALRDQGYDIKFRLMSYETFKRKFSS